MKCENCGAELREGSVYCMVCGKPVQIVPDYNAFDDYLDNLVGEDKSSSIEKNLYNNKNTIKQAQQPVKRPVKDHKEDSKVKTEVVKKKQCLLEEKEEKEKEKAAEKDDYHICYCNNHCFDNSYSDYNCKH